MRSALCLLLLAVFLPGCKVREEIEYQRNLKAPTAQVLAVRAAQHTEEGTRLEIHVRLENPNKAALPMVASEYSVNVELGGGASMSNSPNRTIPGSGSQVVVLPLALAAQGGNLAGRRVHVSGTITYHPPGQLRQLMTESKVPLPKVSFSYDGAIE